MEECRHYPRFEPNQVLTAEQLNGLTDFLEKEERLTRRKLIGIGIVCGLKISLIAGSIPRLILSKGVGVTSEGYLIAIGGNTLTRYRKYIDPIRYPLFWNGESQLNLWELLPDLVTGEDVSIKDLTANFLKDKAVLLYLECNDVDLETCTGDDCDEKGIRRELCIKKLLITKSDLEAIIKKAPDFPASATPQALVQDRFKLPVIRIGRMASLPALGPNVSFDHIYSLYIDLITPVIKELEAALTAGYECYQLILNEDFKNNPFKEGVLKKLLGLIEKENRPAIQYFYDFLKDLLDAYEEFKTAAFDLMTECCPDEGRHPKHLMLGEAVPSGACEPSVYRHPFIAAPIHNGQNQRMQEALVLFKRLVYLYLGFVIPVKNEKGDIRITPGESLGAPLGRRAIPYYYFTDPAISGQPVKALPEALKRPLNEYWNFELSRRCRSDLNLSYYAPLYSKQAFVTQPLKYNMDRFTYYRIEGHLGLNYEGALKRLLALIDQSNIPARVIGLKLGEDFEGTGVLFGCGFKDLEAVYRSLKTDIVCMLQMEIAYFSDLKLGSTAPKYEAGTTGVKGTLKDVSGKGYKEAEVLILDSRFGNTLSRAVPDGGGRFTIDKIAPGKYYMAVNIDGVQIMREMIEVKENQMLDRQIAFELSGAAKKAGRYESEGKTYEYVKTKEEDAPVVVISREGATKGLSYGKEAEPVIRREDTAAYYAGYSASRIEAFYGESKNTVGEYLYELDQMGKGENTLEYAYQYFKKHPFLERYEVADNFARDIFYPVSLIDVMRAVITSLPASLKNLNILLIKGRFETLFETAQQFKKQILENLNSPDYKPTGREGEIIQHLDRLITLCSLDRLESLHATYLERLDEARKLNLFEHFIKKHPGAEHIAGVEKGGTFLIVYDKNHTVVADFALPYICCSDCPPLTTICSTAAVIFKLPKESICRDDETEYRFILSPPGGVVTGAGVRRDEATGDYFFSASGAELTAGEVSFTYLIHDSSHALAVTVIEVTAALSYEFTDVDTVGGVAKVSFTAQPEDADSYEWDFGDGSAISTEPAPVHTYALTGSKQTVVVRLSLKKGICSSTDTQTLILPATETISIDLKPETFCKKDKNIYAITVKPAGGEVTGPGVVKKEGEFFFAPSAADVTVGAATLTYTLSGKTATVSLEVYNPVAGFETGEITRPDPENEPDTYQVPVVNRSHNADTFLWKTGDGQTFGEKEPTIILKGMKPGHQVEILLTASMKEMCPHTTRAVVVIPQTGDGCEMPNLSYPVEKAEVPFLVDFNKEGPHVEVTGLGDVDQKIATVDLKDAKTLVITPHDLLIEVNSYQFTYLGIDTRTGKECEGTITLFIPLRGTRYEGITAIEEKYEEVITKDETLSGNAASVKIFFDNVNREYLQNRDELMTGARNEVIIEDFNKTFDLLIEKAIELDERINASGTAPDPELIRSKEMTVELMNVGMEAFLTTLGTETKDIEATGKVSEYLSSGLKGRIDKLDASSRTVLSKNIEKIAVETSDKVVLTENLRIIVKG